ncbi:putative F-box domain-containing protein [Medicago truncatula]|uniref:F-box protein interaction domain protein n=1 Tax=Medicago truncatula TaxID=3880 RepID=G7KJU1_MEDTR|nr:F-box/kelch-repeat protein At3g23880 [Medicago truncatula]AES77146.1 F-box protein interaction domain protein [Medicago truncatula]RHN53164.1 putative F-box domain-containing protein [Medicago truncatula]
MDAPLQSVPVVIPSDLIAIILTFLPVKTITQLKLVSKSWNTLITSPSFIKIHLNQSSQNPNFILTPSRKQYSINNVLSVPIPRLLTGNTVSGDTYHNILNNDHHFRVVGSCNGLLCLLFKSEFITHLKFRFRIWNPATRTISEELGFFRKYKPLFGGVSRFTFGCDYLRGTYKLVALHTVEDGDVMRSNVRVFNLGNDDSDKCWRNIPNPFVCADGVHLSGTVNWLSLREDARYIEGSMEPLTPHVDHFLIASLDLSTETYKYLLLPKGFKELPCAEPYLRVLLDCLCFLHDFRKTEFVIWQMKEFGVRESWTRLFKIPYVDLQMLNLPIDVQYLNEYPMLPLYISKNGDKVILTNEKDDATIIYNKRDKRVDRARISNEIHWFSAMDYVESLVPTPWKSGYIEAEAEAEEEEEEEKDEDEDENEDEDEDEDEDEEVAGGFFFMMIK